MTAFDHGKIQNKKQEKKRETKMERVKEKEQQQQQHIKTCAFDSMPLKWVTLESVWKLFGFICRFASKPITLIKTCIACMSPSTAFALLD